MLQLPRVELVEVGHEQASVRPSEVVAGRVVAERHLEAAGMQGACEEDSFHEVALASAGGKEVRGHTASLDVDKGDGGDDPAEDT